MPMSFDEIFLEADKLTPEAKAILAEKLMASIEAAVDPEVAQSHLSEVKRRRDEWRAGKIVPVEGEDALAQVRSLLVK